MTLMKGWAEEYVRRHRGQAGEWSRNMKKMVILVPAQCQDGDPRQLERALPCIRCGKLKDV
jgi:hypothetical protein